MEERPYSTLSNEELSAAVLERRAFMSEIQADYFALIREVEQRPDFVPRARPGTGTRTFLRSIGADAPAEDVRLAVALGELTRLAKAIAAGEAGRGHAVVAERAVRAIRDAAPEVLDDAALARVDSDLTDAARDLPRHQFRQVADHLVRVLTHDAADTLDERELERRKLVIWREGNGWTGVEGYLPPHLAAPLWAWMGKHAAPHPAHEAEADAQELLPVHDRRSKRQRQADAFGLAMELALGAGTGDDLTRPHVTIHVRESGPVAESNQAGPLSRSWVGMFLCDATVERLTEDFSGKPLDLGRSVRLAEPHQRRVLVGRDRTCVIPNCALPAEWCDAHHAHWWEKGGQTNVSEMAMVCRRHHVDVHAGIWDLEMRDGIPWMRPPAWIDPLRRWRRNTHREHLETVEQLALDLGTQGAVGGCRPHQ
jgi:hypothetical protein